MGEAGRLRGIVLSRAQCGDTGVDFTQCLDLLLATTRDDGGDARDRRWLTEIAGAEGNAMLAIERMGYQWREGAFRKIEVSRG